MIFAPPGFGNPGPGPDLDLFLRRRRGHRAVGLRAINHLTDPLFGPKRMRPSGSGPFPEVARMLRPTLGEDPGDTPSGAATA